MERQTRDLIQAILAGLAFDIVLCWVISKLFASDGVMESFVFIFLSLQLVPIFFVFKKFVYDWIWFWFTRKRISRQLALGLVERGYPTPDFGEDSALSYLDRIARDNDQTKDLQVSAALDMGMLQAPAQLGAVMQGVRMQMIFEDAMLVLREREAGLSR